MKRTTLFLLMVLFSGAYGCSKEGTASKQGNGGTNKEPITVTLMDGRLTLDIPAGAMAAGTQISVKASGEEFADEPSVLNKFELLPAGTKFNKPVMLTLHYTDEMLQGISPYNVGLGFKNEQDGKWYALIGGKIDTNKKTISVKISHFSHWAYFSGIHLYLQTYRELSRDNEMTLPMLTNENAKVLVVMDLPPLSAEDEEMIRMIEEVGEILKKDPVNPAASEGCADCPLLSPVTFKVPIDVDDVHNRIINPDKWLVNGVTNGNSNTGTISPFGKKMFTYSSPVKMPLDNPIAISAVINTQKHGQLHIIQQVNVYARKWRYEIDRTSARECDGIDDFGYAYKAKWGARIDFTIGNDFEVTAANYTMTPLSILQSGNCTCMSNIKLEPFPNTGIFLSDLKLRVNNKNHEPFPFQIMMTANGREYAEFKASWTTDDCGAGDPHTENDTKLLSEEYYTSDFPIGWIPLSPLPTALNDDGKATITAVQ